MPIASDRAGGINASEIAGIGSGQITPAVGDLMKAFREGFITTDDLIRRGFQLPAEVETARQNLADQREIRPLARQAQAGALQGEIEIQPRKRELQAGQLQQTISSLPTPAENEASSAERAKAAQIRNGLASSDPNVRLNTIAGLSTDDTLNIWTAAHGQPPPEQFEVKGVGNAVRGTSEYFQALKNDLKTADLSAAIQGAQLKALPGVLETQAKTAVEAPVKAAEAQNKAQGDVLMELHKSEALKRFEPQFEAFQKVDAIRNSGRPPTNADDIAILYEYVKLLDPTSAVREGEAKLAQSTVPAVKQLYNQFRGLWSDHNKIFDDTARQSMFNAMDTLRVGAEKSIAPEIERISKIAEDRGVPLDQVFTGPYQAISKGKSTSPIGATITAPGQKPQVGDTFFLPDGRKIRIKAVTATGVIPDETYVP